MIAHVVEGADVRVIERGNRLGLAIESGAALRISGDVGRQHLDGDRAIEAGVACLVHLAHPAFAELLNYLIRAEHAAYHPRASRSATAWPRHSPRLVN